MRTVHTCAPSDSFRCRPRALLVPRPLGIGARLRFAHGPDLRALRLFTAYLALFCVGDSWYAVKLLDGALTYDNGMRVAYLAAAALLALAATDPSMTRIGERATEAAPVDIPFARLTPLALASLLAPATLVVQHLRGAPLHVIPVASACAIMFLLVIARLHGMTRAFRDAAVTDVLTGLRTRRFLTEALGTECARAARTDAVTVAERLRAAVAADPIAGLPVTISAGVAIACEPPTLVAVADGALYESKRSGRDRVTSAEASPVPVS